MRAAGEVGRNARLPPSRSSESFARRRERGADRAPRPLDHHFRPREADPPLCFGRKRAVRDPVDVARVVDEPQGVPGNRLGERQVLGAQDALAEEPLAEQPGTSPSESDAARGVAGRRCPNRKPSRGDARVSTRQCFASKQSTPTRPASRCVSIVDGFPTPRGSDDAREARMGAEARRSSAAGADARAARPRRHVRRAPDRAGPPGSHAGVLFMHNEGYSTMCGHGVIAVTTIALERGLLMPGGDGASIVYDSPAGTIRARARTGRCGRWGRWRTRTQTAVRVESVAFVNVPSFVLHGGLTVKLGVADRFGPTSPSAARSTRSSTARRSACRSMRRHLPELRRVGMEIKHAIEDGVTRLRIRSSRGCTGIYGTIFTGPPSDERADLRNVTIFADAEVDRSPCGTGHGGGDGGGRCDGAAQRRPAVRAREPRSAHASAAASSRAPKSATPAIVPEIEGSAWITGEHTFLVDDEDPLREGFRL